MLVSRSLEKLQQAVPDKHHPKSGGKGGAFFVPKDLTTVSMTPLLHSLLMKCWERHLVINASACCRPKAVNNVSRKVYSCLAGS